MRFHKILPHFPRQFAARTARLVEVFGADRHVTNLVGKDTLEDSSALLVSRGANSGERSS